MALFDEDLAYRLSAYAGAYQVGDVRHVDAEPGRSARSTLICTCGKRRLLVDDHVLRAP